MSSRSRRQTRRRRMVGGLDPLEHNRQVAARKDAKRINEIMARRPRLPAPTFPVSNFLMPYYSREGTVIRIEEWADLFEDNAYRQVCLDRIGAHLVSTVWLGIDHGWGRTSRPIIFETMILDGPHYGYQQRYPTEDCARCGHIEVVEALLEGSTP